MNKLIATPAYPLLTRKLPLKLPLPLAFKLAFKLRFSVLPHLSIWSVILLTFMAAQPYVALAGPGHDHGPAQTTTKPTALPRVAMVGDFADAVATLQGNALTLYLGYAANSRPISKAVIQLSINGSPVPIRETSNGTYLAALAQPIIQADSLDIQAMIESDGLTDVVIGTLDTHIDHDKNSATITDTPYRDADGSVFFPKVTQHQLSLRTQTAKIQEVASTIALNGKVAIDPHTGGLVQTITGGHYEPTADGVPRLGQAVKKGQTLGYLHTHASPLEQANNRAELARLQGELNQARQRLERLEQLSDTTPRKVIDDAKGRVTSLRSQLDALQKGLQAREPLTAPTQGVIASTRAIAGKVFNPGDVVFEVINPKVLRIEANWYEAGGAPAFDKAFLAGQSKPVILDYEGAAGSLINQSMTLVFEAHFDKPQPYSLGQLVTLYAQTKATRRGMPLPQEALLKNTANQSIVWIKTQAERLEPRVVVTEPYNGNEVLIVSGLQAGERVVTSAANLVNQVR